MNLEEIEERLRRLEENQGNFPARWAQSGGSGNGRGAVMGKLQEPLYCNRGGVTFFDFNGKSYQVWEGYGEAVDTSKIYGILWHDVTKHGFAAWILTFEACVECPPQAVVCIDNSCAYIWDEDTGAWVPPPADSLLPRCPDGCHCPPPVTIPRGGEFDGEVYFLNCGQGDAPLGGFQLLTNKDDESELLQGTFGLQHDEPGGGGGGGPGGPS